MKNKEIEKLLENHEWDLEFETSSCFINPLPTEIYLNVDNDDYLIEVSLNANDVLKAKICVLNDEVKLTDSNIDFIYIYLSDKLKDKIKEVKDDYEALEYLTYYIR